MLQQYSENILPNWVKKDRDQLSNLKHEIQHLQKQYSAFHFFIEDDEEYGTLYAHGCIFTFNKNVYKVRLYFPPNYPNCQPLPIVVDEDVIQDYEYHSRDHNFPPNFGVQKYGLALDIRDIATQWDPRNFATTVLDATTIWLHKYELWKNE